MEELSRYVVHSSSLPPEQGGELLSLPREKADWEWMSFFVHRLIPGEARQFGSSVEETALVLLGGKCVADWGEGGCEIGERRHVFDGLPYALYLPPGEGARVQAKTICEIAECRVPANSPVNAPANASNLAARLITPRDVAVVPRGGGNVSREIVDVMPPSFPSQRIMAVEVYTPGGNWSSYPPHKHEVHNPPAEVDLDEIYYYRIAEPEGFAYQRLYSSDGSRDLVITARDGDVVLVRDGYHPVVAGPGYNTYYLNFLAGSEHSLANTEDPRHVWIRTAWGQPGPGLPVVPR
jgi:5-deoxy-glucuronate isomerase